MQPTTRDRILLNGWWDFQPVAHPDLREPLLPGEVPSSGWTPQSYLVPGFFTDHSSPPAWRESRSGWMRRSFTLAPRDGQRAYLTIGAAIPKAFIYLNGRQAGVQEDMFIGDAIDVTDLVHPGENELAVLLTEFPAFPHPDSGAPSLIDVPWGCCIAHEQAGIWQDVTLEWRPQAHIDDITIRTSVRNGALTVLTRVHNAGMTHFTGKVTCCVEDGGKTALHLPEIDIAVPAGEIVEVEQTAAWADYHPWSPEDPYLYLLHTELHGEGGDADEVQTRFGFREIWIEGHRILLNGRPQRWSGEWCHKAHSHWLRPEYVRQWFQQLKDLNMNYARMHTFPHPDYVLDIADEMGILVCQESALHGSGQWGYETAALWERARAHVRRMVRRDKNHPSLVLWSVENEMRWALNLMPGAREELPKLRDLFNTLDPTRPAYHDGDSALWNEDTQAIISRHYGPACHGLGWWEKRAPLHAGEVGRWHYASPYVALQWAGDEVFTDYALLSQSLAADAARICELGRANEVSCLFVWNTSGLDNFRPGEARTFTWEEPNTPFLKPLAHRSYESEYAWWEDGPGYRPGHSFATLRHAFRPLAIVIREERTGFYLDGEAPHTVSVVNDHPEPVAGTLAIRLSQAGETRWEEEHHLTVGSGETGTVACRVPLQACRLGEAVITTTFTCACGSDEVVRQLRLADSAALNRALQLPPVGVLGDSALIPWLVGHGISIFPVGEGLPFSPYRTPILLVPEHSIEPGSRQHKRIQEFLHEGGRVLVLEQDHSLFPNLPIARQPIEMAFVRDETHPVMKGIAREDLRFFGDDPFGLPSSDSWVTLYPYVKPSGDAVIRSLVDSSGGDFGTGGLGWAPVIEAHIGAGILLAVQLRISDRWRDLPVIDHLLCSALDYLANYRKPAPVTLWADAAMLPRLITVLPPEHPLPLVDDAPDAGLALYTGDLIPMEDQAELLTRVRRGQTAVVWGMTEAARPFWERVIGRPITQFTPDYPVYHLIAAAPSPLLAGISNEDTCWLDNWTYRGSAQKAEIVDTLLAVEGGTSLLRNADRAGLDILYGDDQATEWKRMPALSAFFDGPPPRVGAGLLEVKLGRGRVIFCQMHWRPELWQFRRFLDLFLWNLGLPMGTDILDGPFTPREGRRSNGSPARLRACRTAKLDELLSLSKRRVEYCADNTTFAAWPEWQLLDTPDGCLQAGQLPGSGPIILGLEVNTPEPRKFMQTVGGLPNPDLQTSLCLTGAGRLHAWINGEDRGTLPLAPGTPAYLVDIDFEAGSNYLVLEWEPTGDGDELQMCFENKDQRPEISFAFPI